VISLKLCFHFRSAQNFFSLPSKPLIEVFFQQFHQSSSLSSPFPYSLHSGFIEQKSLNMSQKDKQVWGMPVSRSISSPYRWASKLAGWSW
jgi:hypothetical protein